jgi:hypothetical protein
VANRERAKRPWSSSSPACHRSGCKGCKGLHYALRSEESLPEPRPMGAYVARRWRRSVAGKWGRRDRRLAFGTKVEVDVGTGVTLACIDLRCDLDRDGLGREYAMADVRFENFKPSHRNTASGRHEPVKLAIRRLDKQSFAQTFLERTVVDANCRPGPAWRPPLPGSTKYLSVELLSPKRGTLRRVAPPAIRVVQCIRAPQRDLRRRRPGEREGAT